MSKKKIIFLSMVIVFAVGYVLLSHLNRQSAIDSTLEWSRLAPFPKKVNSFKIETEGSMFSRAFRISFQADSDTIQQWLRASPGIQDASITIDDGKIRKYEIKPGGGAQHAEVMLNIQENLVRIYTYWS